ncbi:secreted protein [Candidatus Omnitrophus magneticus]|uniref:Secreted protein n=1 Tax=Candidatus Omnitrophus magneticus TaxID=1609969 RepID=A0A0F0CRK5_9BACT|nr:secreted protein [Candidatus Omnitrophus magneticus]
MKIILKYTIIIVLLLTVCPFAIALDKIQLKHINQLFELRNNIIAQGETLPNDINKSTEINQRTLERIFELNTSALTTIEAYFRMLKVAIASNAYKNTDTLKILNEWLKFINNQCKYDIEYLTEAEKETKILSITNQINIAKNNMILLGQITQEGINENSF